jgi:hypothetical protein
LHPLWEDVQERVKEVNQTEVREPYDKGVVLDERMMRIAIIMYGYLKRVAAIRCIKTGKNMILVQEALEYLDERILRIHDPLNWEIDVKKRIEAIGCGEW